MSRRILLFILIVGLFSSFSYADYSQNPPVTRIRLSQQLVTSLLRYTRSDIIPEIDLKLLPVENQIELTGRVKGKVYEYLLFAGERYREETPLGTRFSLKFEIKALDDGFLKFVFHKFELGEGINTLPLFNRNYNPQAGELYGQPHLVVETLLWLFKLAPMQDYLVRVKNLEAKTVDIRDLFRFDEEGSMSFKVKSDVISRFLPSPHLEELRIWGLESVVDVDANKVALELALGKGTREHFLPYLKTRRVAYPYWWKEKLRKAAAGEKDLRQNDIHVLQTISIPTLNEIMEAVLPMLNTDKSQKAYDNKEDKAFLFKKVAFELVQASDNPKKSQLKAKIVLKTWDEDGWWGIFPRTKSIWTEVESVYDVKVKLRAKDNNHVEGELYGVELSGKDITWLLTLAGLIQKWLIPLIDNPEDDNDTVNKFVKITPSLERESFGLPKVDLNISKRISLPFLDFVLDSVWLRHSYQELTFRGNMVFPLTPYHLEQLESIERELDIVLGPSQADYFDKVDEKEAAIEVAQRAQQIFDTIAYIENQYPKSTATGKEAMQFLHSYAKLGRVLRVVAEPSEALEVLNKELLNVKIPYLIDKYKASYLQFNKVISQEKTFWTQHLYDDAVESANLYEDALSLLE